MDDDIVTRLRERIPYAIHPHVLAEAKLLSDAVKEIERLLEWKELAYEMRNRSWWAMRKKVLIKFDGMHKRDWAKHRE
jgi:hypothetical protein